MPELHPAFENAGQSEGMEIWRVEDFEPVPVPKQDFGKFYTGDSYIVLKTTGASTFNWDVHFWLGSATSQDEAGAAAILSVCLDEAKFNGAAVQYRETQGHESKRFLGYFEPAIRYLNGGHASGFSHVVTNAGAEKRLFQIKGKRNVCVRQVVPSASSMNNGDCFILDVDHNIYVYVGVHAKNTERIKAINVANQIRDQDHNGRSEIEIIDQYSSDADINQFFEVLGSGDKDSIPDDSGSDDEVYEQESSKEVKLNEISDSSGNLKITPVSSPFTQESLKSTECYILDTGHHGIYVWVGKQSNSSEKSEAMKRAEQYLKTQNYPNWAHVMKVPEGFEPTAFRQYFENWQD